MESTKCVLQRIWLCSSVFTNNPFVRTDLPFLLLLSPFSSSSSSQSDVLRKSKLPRAVSTVRLTMLGERLCLPPYTHARTNAHTCTHTQIKVRQWAQSLVCQTVCTRDTCVYTVCIYACIPHMLSMLTLTQLHNRKTHSQH